MSKSTAKAKLTKTQRLEFLCSSSFIEEHNLRVKAGNATQRINIIPRTYVDRVSAFV